MYQLHSNECVMVINGRRCVSSVCRPVSNNCVCGETAKETTSSLRLNPSDLIYCTVNKSSIEIYYQKPDKGVQD